MGLFSASERGPSILYLVGCLLAVSLLTGVIVALIGIEMPSAMGVINLMVSASLPVTAFVTHVGRAMTKSERVRFATLGTVATGLISVALLAALNYAVSGAAVFEMVMREAQSMWAQMPWLVVALPVIALGGGWLILYFASGMFSKQALKALEMKAGK